MATAKKSRIWRTLSLLITVCFLSLPAQAKFSGGTGEPNDPYKIDKAADLILLGDSPEDYDKHFVLTADIDLAPNLPDGKVFDRAVIAPMGTVFTGIFDGNGHTISHLTIEGVSYLGLFGQLDFGANISNLGLEAVDINGTGNHVGGLVGSNNVILSFLPSGIVANCYSTGTVSGDEYVGGLVGDNAGPITSSYSTGTVNGTGWNVGGLVGSNHGSIATSYSTSTVSGNWYVGGLVGNNFFGLIATSYSIGTVSGEVSVGGLVGSNDGSIITSYSTGKVSGNKYVGGLVGSNYDSVTTSYSTGMVSGDWRVGGLVGYNAYGSVTSSFWDIETSGQAISAGGTGLTTAEMQEIDTYLHAGWDFVDEIGNGTCDYWQISEVDYPRLRYHAGQSPVMPEGLGTVKEPYLIRDAMDLGTVWFQPSAHYCLEASLDLSGIAWSMAVIPWFEGTFDGNGYVISNLHIQGGGYLGLFGQLGSGAKISNVNLEVVDVNGTGSYVGGLVGTNDGGIINASYSIGTVSGTGWGAGGLVGINSLGIITTSYSTGTVSGEVSVGGLVGYSLGSIATSYSNSTVSGYWYVGGLVGRNDWNITTSYSINTVSGEHGVGGLVGGNAGSITTSYSIGMVSGELYVGGLVGSNGNSITNSYSNSTVIGRSCVGGLVGVNALIDIGSGSVTRSYSIGKVTGNEYVGGLIGYASTDLVTASFWDSQTSGQTTSAGGAGKTTDEMQTTSTFIEAGWDFMGETANGTEDVWDICEGTNYPRLVWQIPIGDFVCPDGVSMLDFSFFATHWLDDNCDVGNDYCQGTDLDTSGTVDASDLEIFFDIWLAGIAP